MKINLAEERQKWIHAEIQSKASSQSETQHMAAQLDEAVHKIEELSTELAYTQSLLDQKPPLEPTLPASTMSGHYQPTPEQRYVPPPQFEAKPEISSSPLQTNKTIANLDQYQPFVAPWRFSR